MNHLSEPCLAKPLPRFTDKQGQYLAFIHAYTLVNRRPPGRADIQNFFRITPPSVHQMLLTLEREGLIARQKAVARSIQVLVNPADLLPLQPVKITVQGIAGPALLTCCSQRPTAPPAPQVSLEEQTRSAVCEWHLRNTRYNNKDIDTEAQS